MATLWRMEDRNPGGIRLAWLVAGLANYGSIILILLIVLKIGWSVAGLCVVTNIFGTILLTPISVWIRRSVFALWMGAIILMLSAAYMFLRII